MNSRNEFFRGCKKAMLLALCLYHTTNIPAQKRSNAHIGLIYPISSNGTAAPQYSNSFSLHLLAGVSGSERAVAFSGFSNIIKDSARGVQLAGFSNHIGGTSHGATLAGFMNTVRHANGLQAAGFLNVAGAAKGCQLAGFGNVVINKLAQAQADSYKQVQIAGFLNKGENVNTQVAGFINLAKKVKGAQIAGFINIADSSDYPIGIINFIRHGEKTIGLSTDETLTTLLSFRSGGRVMYGILGIGYNFRSSKNRYALEAGIGAHLRVNSQFRINAELASIMLDDFKAGDYFKYTLRILPAWKLGSRFEIFGGPTFNCVDISTIKNTGLIKHYLWKETKGDHFHGLYFGAMGGIHFAITQ